MRPLSSVAARMAPRSCSWPGEPGESPISIGSAAEPHVEPAEEAGRSRWKGGGQIQSQALCQAIRRVLADDQTRPPWSKRAIAQMETIRTQYPWLSADGSNVLLTGADGEVTWWTFGGGLANASLAGELANRFGKRVISDNFAIRFEAPIDLPRIEAELADLVRVAASEFHHPVSETARDHLKFSECLPNNLADRVIKARLQNTVGVAAILK